MLIKMILEQNKRRIHIKAFSLPELLMVLLVIALLLSFLLPAVTKIREMGFQVQCSNNYKQIYLLLNKYSQDNEGHLPMGHPNHYYPDFKGAKLTYGWHGALAPYVFQIKDNNWNQHNGQPFVQELLNVKYRDILGTLEYETLDTLGVFLCPKAMQVQCVTRTCNGLPYSYIAAQEFFGNSSQFGSGAEWTTRYKIDSKKLSDIESPDGKILMYEGAPNAGGWSSPGSSIGSSRHLFAASMSPMMLTYYAAKPEDEVGVIKGWWPSLSTNRHGQMIFLHDNDDDVRSGYQMDLFADGHVQKAHEWWLYLKYPFLFTMQGKGRFPGDGNGDGLEASNWINYGKY